MSTKSVCQNVKDATKYCKDVVAGKIPACKWVILACQRHLDDLIRSKDKTFPYVFDEKRAEKVLRFIQLLPHTKGKWAAGKQNIRLEPWQKFSIGMPFGWIHREKCTRRYRKILIFVPRKNGKSIIAGGIGNYMLSMDGEYGAEVYSGATTEKQAWEVFRPAKLMIERTPELREHCGIEVNAGSMIILRDGSRFEPVIGKPGDGSSPSCAIVDEYHEHQTSDLYDTMETGMGAREQPVMLVITTAGSSIGGPCYQMCRDAQRMLDGAIDDPETWAMLYTTDDGDDWTSEDALIKANPNYGISIDADFLRSRQREAMQSSQKQAIFRTKHLNHWVGAKTTWINILKWNTCKPRLPLKELEGRPCYVGVDFASKVDIAALVAVFPPHGDDDDRWHVHGWYYSPENRVLEMIDGNSALYRQYHSDGLLTLTEGDVIDFEAIKDDLRGIASRFDLQQVGFDPWQATQFASEMIDEGLNMIEVRQTVQNMSAPMKEVEALVMSGTLSHGSCPVLTWMASNVVAKIDAKDNIYPNKERSENKIDGVVALIIAINRAMTSIADTGSSIWVLE